MTSVKAENVKGVNTIQKNCLLSKMENVCSHSRGCETFCSACKFYTLKLNYSAELLVTPNTAVHITHKQKHKHSDGSDGFLFEKGGINWRRKINH